jgi:hypothetical protein
MLDHSAWLAHESAPHIHTFGVAPDVQPVFMASSAAEHS